ncbi:hypothetical protein PABG_01826 [Paracoccidioides brasiliensis Pb03]|nr:hypothetical protein PABG_01826 [Paracoccidioides brasiliensis Pb03]
MGLPKPNRPFRDDSPLPSSASAHSLQTYQDVEPEENPPAYTDDDTLTIPQSRSPINTNNLSSVGRLVSPYDVPGGRMISSSRAKKTYTVTLEPQFSQNPKALCSLVTFQANRPPVPIIVVKGTHTVTNKNSGSNKGSSKDTVVDFDFRINCVGSVLPDVDQLGDRCRFVEVVQDNDGRKKYRGGRLKSKGGSKNKKQDRVAGTGTNADLEEGQGLTAGSDGPDLEEWCRRFCNDKAGVKSFTFHRALEVWNHPVLHKGITTLIRSLNYRGHICIEIHTHNAHLTVYSPSLLNKLRTHSLVWWACVLLQLWIITWPLLWLLEKRYEPITAIWYARYDEEYACGLSETAWLEFFTPVIKRSVLGRARDGEVVGLEEAKSAREEASIVARGEGQRLESEAERERRERVQRGQGGWADSLVGVVRGVAEVGMEINQVTGWGGDR